MLNAQAFIHGSKSLDSMGVFGHCAAACWSAKDQQTAACDAASSTVVVGVCDAMEDVESGWSFTMSPPH